MSGPQLPRMRIIGPGRAGGSLALALAATGRWVLVPALGRDDDVRDAAQDVDVVVIATPDAAIAEVAAAIEPAPTATVVHLAGSLGLDVVGTHPRRGALHPLVALPEPGLGGQRLRAGAWFAIAGDPVVDRIVADLGGRAFTVADADRAAYHAAACIASNHLVALLGQVARVAGGIGVPFDPYLDLARTTLDNVAELGPAAALTGPAARGDWATIERHRAALDPAELDAYDAMVAAARRLVGDAD